MPYNVNNCHFSFWIQDYTNAFSFIFTATIKNFIAITKLPGTLACPLHFLYVQEINFPSLHHIYNLPRFACEATYDPRCKPYIGIRIITYGDALAVPY